jgi:putative heme-binding domain-containing protein
MLGSAGAHPVPPIKERTSRRGDPRKGRVVFATTGTCAKCHAVNSEGKDVAPNLSEIGAKLSRVAPYESNLFPSAAINHTFATYTVVLSKVNVLSGIVISRADEALFLKGNDAIARTYSASEVEEIKEQPTSLIPSDLQQALTPDDLVNVAEYLTTLRFAPGRPTGSSTEDRGEGANGARQSR